MAKTNPLLAHAFVGLLLASPCLSATHPATEFLRYVYGAKDVAVDAVCWPNPDLWMLAGPKNDRGLAEIAELKLSPGKNEIIWELVDGGLCIVEVREGKLDARFMLDQSYFQHRQTILRFIYAALEHDLEDLKELATDPKKVRFGRTKPAPHTDMAVYGEMLALLPVIRTSLPADDKVAKSVTYLVPLGKVPFKLRLVKRPHRWLVDTDAGVDVPLEIFYEETAERRVIYPR